jgi:hypothetical protein
MVSVDTVEVRTIHWVRPGFVVHHGGTLSAKQTAAAQHFEWAAPSPPLKTPEATYGL